LQKISPSPSGSAPNAIFVYGTLQRGQLRDRLWPCPAERILVARVRGTLYDLGPYPALIAGTDWVQGERWELPPRAMPRVLEVLDGIEGFANRSDDLYRRVQLDCLDETGQTRTAFAYLFARPDALQATDRILPNVDGYCSWTAR
jgi:gamma-glutamylcyclotransferase (GGCT)/AIG2-like uncharacterized protein YtfP